ncbi:hypothetical protein H2200_001899 [Cladophialophora chaetospira]|uniref:Alpha/beta hydrolase fold-3 domain-containing protein n=1 Tax=Cladophialophora chaetospira TaxID=386627 RepID=A0AA38XLR4_9EURO|nr:hypothetical protein H2200_001899 [Cladophialophora chaetospira]
MATISFPKFAAFTVLSTTYKTVHGHPIEVYTLIPKLLLENITPASQSQSSSKPAPLPLVVKFHGGFLVAGDAIYEEWFPQWLVDYTLQHSALVVLPNYRLLPEANGLEILEDVHDFWAWLKTDFQTYLKKEAEGVEVDLGKVLVTGESAGGYLSIQSALGSSGGLAKACVATYPVLDVSSRFYTEEYEKAILGAPMLPKEVLAEHIEAIEEDAKNGKKRVVTGATPPQRLPFALSIVQQGLYKKFLGDDKILDPFQRVDDVDAKDMPPILIIHGKEDTAVPVEGSEKWVEKVKGKFGNEKVELILRPGDHGFDNEPSITLEAPWLKDGLVTATEAWLR